MTQGPVDRYGSPTAGWIGALVGDPAGLDRARAPEAASAAVTILGEETTAWAIEQAAQVYASFLAEVTPDELTEGNHEHTAVEASILAMLTTLVTHRRFETPAAALDQVRWAARQGLSVDAVLRVIWRAHAGVQNSLIDVVTAEVPGDRLAGAVKQLSAVLLEVVGTLIRDLTAVFERESAAWGRDRAAAIRTVVDRVVDTGEPPADAEEVLGIRLSDHHLAAVICPAGTPADPGWRSDIARWVEMVGERLDAATALVIPRGDGPTEAIWSRPALPTVAELEGLRGIGLPADVGVGFGIAAAGPQGLADSVIAARRVAGALSSTHTAAIWTYDEHGVLALLMNDPDACGDFVHRTLPGLLGPEEKMQALRETLLCYLEHAGSRTLAAQQLHIAPTTVAYRVRQAQERLDPRVPRTRTGLVLALTLARHFPALAQ